MTRCLACTGGALLALIPLPTWGQSQIYFGPTLGIQHTSHADNTNYLTGATLRMKVAGLLGIEGSVRYRQEQRGSIPVTIHDWPISATGLVYPQPVFYAGVGGGWHHTTYDYGDQCNNLRYQDHSNTEFGWDLVAGLELPVSRSLLLSVDTRYTFLDLRFRNLPKAITDDVDSDFYSVSLSTLFKL